MVRVTMYIKHALRHQSTSFVVSVYYESLCNKAYVIVKNVINRQV